MKPVCTAALCILVAVALATSTHAEEPTPAEIFKTIHTQFDHLTSLDIAARSARFMGEMEPDLSWTVDTAEERVGKQAKYLTITSTNLRQKEAMFRIYVDRPDERHDFAYDGTQYQRFLLDHRLLQIVNAELVHNVLPDVQYTAVRHFFLGYQFACDIAERPVSLETLRDPSLWESLVPLSEVRGEEMVNGEPCVVVEITNSEHKRSGVLRARVFFAKNLAYFPIRYEEYIGDDIYLVFEAADVQEPRSCRKRPDDVPAHYFPNKSVLHDFDWMGSGRTTGGAVYELNADAARVNCEIPDAFFTIPESEALHVIGERSTD